MTHRIQEAFTELHQVTKEKSLFAGKKNEWICKLNPTEMGMIGEKLVSDVLGGAITRERAIGYNVIAGEKLIEVKNFTIEWFSKIILGTNKTKRQIHTYLFCCCISRRRTRFSCAKR